MFLYRDRSSMQSSCRNNPTIVQPVIQSTSSPRSRWNSASTFSHKPSKLFKSTGTMFVVCTWLTTRFVALKSGPNYKRRLENWRFYKQNACTATNEWRDQVLLLACEYVWPIHMGAGRVAPWILKFLAKRLFS